MKKLTIQPDTEEQDILLVTKSDRRLLSKVPDKDGVRSNVDRRRLQNSATLQDMSELISAESIGKRYIVNYPVELGFKTGSGKVSRHGQAVDISASGILIEVPAETAAELQLEDQVSLAFEITPGSMPEGYEMKVSIAAKYVRSAQADGKIQLAFEFTETLAEYSNRKKGRYLLTTASLFLFFVVAFIILLRAESVVYFKFNKVLYTYSIIAASFLLTRYLFSALYRPVPIDKEYTPGVTVIIPCFNEEQWIQRTITGCINQDYPIDRLEVIVVDDCSNDRSFERITEFVDELKSQEARYNIEQRLFCVRQEKNAGKREAMARGALMAKHDLLVFVDSDSFLDPFAVRHLVQPFKDANTGGVSGRTDVANTYTNALTKLQSVRYYISFRIMKAAESYFDAVTCLSGPLACYRKDLVLRYLDSWLGQTFLGQRATFGDDRSMTNFILREHHTVYQDTAICHTIVPNRHSVFLRQQMRWKRSWLRESLIAARFMWRKEPFMALSFYMGVLVPLIAPLIVLYNLVYIPLLHRVFPTTFLLGLLMMALLMSMAQLLLRRSSTWAYGLLFCLYYEAVLLWQMPIAWFTFYKANWGTRMTPADIFSRMKKKPKATTGA